MIIAVKDLFSHVRALTLTKNFPKGMGMPISIDAVKRKASFSIVELHSTIKSLLVYCNSQNSIPEAIETSVTYLENVLNYLTPFEFELIALVYDRLAFEEKHENYSFLKDLLDSYLTDQTSSTLADFFHELERVIDTMKTKYYPRAIQATPEAIENDSLRLQAEALVLGFLEL